MSILPHSESIPRVPSCGLGLILIGLLAACSPSESDSISLQKAEPLPAPEPVGGLWTEVEKGLERKEMQRDGALIRYGDRVLFRFQAPQGTRRVYLAGNFNDWARNQDGKITHLRSAMQPGDSDLWTQWVRWDGEGEAIAYQYVVEGASGQQRWCPDPHVSSRDGDGNTRLEWNVIEDRSIFSGDGGAGWSVGTAPQPLEPVSRTLRLRREKVVVPPGEPQRLTVESAMGMFPAKRPVRLTVSTPEGERVHRAYSDEEEPVFDVPGLREGAYLARVEIEGAGYGDTVLSVVDNVADDLRYGFYASFGAVGRDYVERAEQLKRMHVNAVEFYDYFPAHGDYAPQAEEYRFEPFGIEIRAEDVRRKIEAGRKAGILSLAYVAAYAASPSIYKNFPYPMTDRDGNPKIFNGRIMTEAEARAAGKPVWFYLMNIAEGSPWRSYILDEFRRALDDGPEDWANFDGFEIDTYGDQADTVFYAPRSPRNGDLLQDVLRDFVKEVGVITREVNPRGLVSFNSVNEFGATEMAGVTDFFFLEIWREHADRLEDLADIAYDLRRPNRQRTVLKLYPSDLKPGAPVWPAESLRRVLGAAMTGGGTLMVAGEPDEEGRMHGLNTLYYPDHQPLGAENEEILRRYYRHDALHYGYTHGRQVRNAYLDVRAPGCIVRSFAAPDKKALVVSLLRTNGEARWSVSVAETSPLRPYHLHIHVPHGVRPDRVLYSSPDNEDLMNPTEAVFEMNDEILTVALPELRVHGTVMLIFL
jgi:hypothetical protein